jgi:DNA-directed RNA polymerase specialized sigma24 family protein
MGESKNNHPDREFVNQILSGDQKAWAQFVDQFTDRVFYVANQWTKSSDSENISVRKYLMQSNKTGEKYTYTEEAEDAYLWIMDQLRNKLQSYRGESRLSTYIWSILHHDWLKNDYLRWKYGDKRKIPKVLKNVPDLEKQVFIRLRWKKNIEKIASELSISIALVEELQEKIMSKLRRAGQEDMITPPKETELSETLLHTLTADPELETEDRLLINELKSKFLHCFQQTLPEKQSLIRLFYKHHLQVSEIDTAYKQANKPFLGEIRANQVTESMIRSTIKKIRNEILKCFQEIKKSIRNAVVNDSTIVTFLQDQNICDAI